MATPYASAGRHRQPLADVAERALADPPHPRLHVLEDRQQQVALVAGLVAAVHGAPTDGPRGSAAVLRRRGAVQERVDRRSLGVRRRSEQQSQVHQTRLPSRPAVPVPQRSRDRRSPSGQPRRRSRPSPTRPAAVASASSTGSFSTRIAVALNSAVPDFGSVASIVRIVGGDLFGEVERHEREARAAEYGRSAPAPAPPRVARTRARSLRSRSRAAPRPRARGRATRRDAAASGTGSTGRRCCRTRAAGPWSGGSGSPRRVRRPEARTASR